MAEEAPARGSSPLGVAAKRLVSLDVQEVTARELSSQLSTLAGMRVVYVPAQGGGGKGGDGISLQVQDFPLGDLVAILAKQGSIAIGGRDFRPAPPTGFDKRVLQQQVTISAKDADAESISSLLTGLLGAPVEWSVPDAGMTMNLDFKDVTVRDVLKQLDKLGEISVPGLQF